ncbi:MAG: TlyA family RNA methyltransferase [Neomegalonema sp.]|nr:TlyA family RNA methyltransferase [Neomegalonema sp.]
MSKRLDQALVDAGLASSRARAQALIKADVVRVDEAPARKASQMVTANAALRVIADPCPWVSRAALKLAHALDHFELSPQGDCVLDIGASTGGFSQVCLSHGARRVIAMDVGRDQLHDTLRSDARVTVIEGLNAKDLSAEHLPEPADWLVCDVSFIALHKALPAALALLSRPARIVVLVKPQFELSPDLIGKGGIVRDHAAQQTALDGARAFIEAQGGQGLRWCESPILGGDGNREFLLTAQMV